MTRSPRGPAAPPDDLPAEVEQQGDLVSSAAAGSQPSIERTAGSIHLGSPQLAEAVARDALNHMFAQAGMPMQNDYPFRSGNTIIALDGFDPLAKVGYQYVSHADVDVVTDFDATAEMELRQLDGAGKIRLFIVHDGDVRDVEELVAMAVEFIASLDRTSPG